MEGETLSVVNEDREEKTRAQIVIEKWKESRAEDLRLFEEERKTPEYKKMIEDLKKRNEENSNLNSI